MAVRSFRYVHVFATMNSGKDARKSVEVERKLEHYSYLDCTSQRQRIKTISVENLSHVLVENKIYC